MSSEKYAKNETDYLASVITNKHPSYVWQMTTNRFWRNSQFPKFSDLKPLITGHARIIYYDVYGKLDSGEFSPFVDPKKNNIISIKEGTFVKSKAEGYGRHLVHNK